MPRTPDPWETHCWGDDELEIVGADGTVVCNLRQEYDSETGAGLNERITDDGELIAAAPKLLDALKQMVDSVRSTFLVAGWDPTAYVEYQAALAAIAAAEGRTDGNASS